MPLCFNFVPHVAPSVVKKGAAVATSVRLLQTTELEGSESLMTELGVDHQHP